MLPCPDPNTLRALVAGRLSGVTLGAAAAHVDRCPDCLACARQIDPGFDPVRAIQGQVTFDAPLIAESKHAGGWATRARHWTRRHQALVAGVAAAVVVGLLVGGLGWWLLERKEAERREEAARREAQDRQAVESALQQAETLLGQGRLAEAQATLVQAAVRLANGGSEDLKERLRRIQEDLRMVQRLDQIRLDKASLIDGKVNLHGTRRAYEAAFREHGLDVLNGDAAELVRRIAASPHKEELVAALDDWAGLAADNRTRARLLALARQADPDPLRNRLRDPAVLRDRQKLTQLATHAEVGRLSPALLVLVGSRLEALGGPGLELLQRAQRHYPADFWLNFELANVLQRRKHARWDEAAGFFRAALAMRPHSAAVYNNLGLAEYAKGDLDGAIAAFRQAIMLDPKHALAHGALGQALLARGDRAGARAATQHALQLLAPGDPQRHLLSEQLRRCEQ